MTISERITQIAELVCETAAELKKRQTDILKSVNDGINSGQVVSNKDIELNSG